MKLLSPSLLLAFFLCASSLRADYPIVSQRYLADPASLVHDGRVYLYCSNDDENAVEGGYVMRSIVCVSSSDLKNWTDHGVVFRVPDNASWARFAWAPAVIARNGKVYLYFGNNASGIGVAAGTGPLGPFTDAKGRALIDGNTPGVLPAPNIWIFDPAVFIDDDGQAYLYFGGNGVSNARVIKLNPDMISTAGSAVTITTPNFFEASWMHKRDGLYYFSYSANPSSGLSIDYLTSTNPMTGFTYRGTVAGQPPSNNNNNHHAIFSLNGVWYHAYHNRVVATQAGIPTTYRRNLGIERLTFNADGTIQPVAYTTDGIAQLASVNPYLRCEAETINAQSGIETEAFDGGMAVRFTQPGAWVRIRGVDFGPAGASAFNVRVATASAGGSLEIRLGSANGQLVGTCAIAPTGGAGTWRTASCAVSGASGVQDVCLVFNAPAAAQLNVDWWRFDSVAPAVFAEPADKVVFPGAALVLSVEASGRGNRFQWSRDGAVLPGQTNAVLRLADASAGDAGTYAVVITNDAGTVTSRGAVVRVSPEASRLVNMSCRTQLGAGQVVSPGFFLAGSGSKQVLIRAAGPALASFGLAGTLADPQLKLFRGAEVIAQNDNWDAATVGDAFGRVGAFGFTAGSKDAALLATLAAGQTYTVQVTGAAGGGGFVLLEVYDADAAAPTCRFTNVSVRGNAGPGAGALVLGFVLRGSGDRPLLVRGAGPALTAFGVSGALADPQLTVFDADGRSRYANAGWTTVESVAALSAAADAVGAFAFSAGSRDAATLTLLPPSLYTVQVGATGSGSGEALAEVYEVP